MSNPWFRMYSEFATDPKVQMLPEAYQRRLLMVMCMRCSNSLVTLQEQEIAFQLRITETELAETKAVFIQKGFVDKHWNILNWEKRQFASDTSASRVAKHRALQKEKQKQDCNVTETKSNALEQNRTDTDKSNTEAKASVGRATRKCPESFVVEDAMRTWAATECPLVDLELETAKLRDHTYKTARSDWAGAWRNWLRTAQQDAESRLSKRGAYAPVNKQEALENRNREVANRWAGATP